MGKAKRRAVAGAGAEAQDRDWMIAEEEMEVGESLGRGWQGETFRGRWNTLARCRDMHGVCCCEGGQAEVVDVEVSDCGRDGVTSLDEGSKVVVRGGRIVRCRTFHGVDCNRGGKAEVRNVEISECGSYGLFSCGGSLTHSGCTVTGCGRGARFGC